MSDRNTLIRSLHDIGLAAWFGGSLMGAVGLNGATDTIRDPERRNALGATGWARWAPVSAAAIGVHAIGGVGLTLANKGRLVGQRGVATTAIVKTALTGVAAASTAYSAWQGRVQAEAGLNPTDGAVNSGPDTPAAGATARQHLRIAQWITPITTAALIVLAAQQGEQQRAGQVVSGILGRARTALS
ncbi:hypothetical protein [Nakamurella deserti]|uniref:hypothetical protein n=1 Tax=Nakamurella deserti TaxID=2164074 RepID=UPI000DBEA0DF|nr:hypothetical protein [Nakamurella deserti]